MSLVSTASTAERWKTAIELAREGDKDEARAMLKALSEEEPRNEKAWLWRASLAESPDRAAEFLERVLEIDPLHSTAAGWLKKLRQQPERVVAESKVNCPFCRYQSANDFA